MLPEAEIQRSLGRLEGSVESLISDVGGLRTEMAGIREDFREHLQNHQRVNGNGSLRQKALQIGIPFTGGTGLAAVALYVLQLFAR